MKKVLAASTSYGNNSESDLMPKVLHDVTLNIDGKTIIIQLMAIDPIDALNLAHNMTEENCLSLAIN